MLRKRIRASSSKESRCLQGWAGAAGEKMSSARSSARRAASGPAAADQQAAIDELEKIWDAVIPFHPLLARDLADQTKIAAVARAAPVGRAEIRDKTSRPVQKGTAQAEKQSQPRKARPQPPVTRRSATESDDLAPLTEMQERTLRRTQLLKLKAEAELARLEKSPPPDAGSEGTGSVLCRQRRAKDARGPSQNRSIPS